MNKSEINKLLTYYQQQLDNANESINDMKTKRSSETSRLYNEYTLRYKEGFRDAMDMVIPHLTKLMEESESEKQK
ncbi:MAG: hypothetical protein QMB63_03205 [Clostridiaceae bacterium]